MSNFRVTALEPECRKEAQQKEPVVAVLPSFSTLLSHYIMIIMIAISNVSSQDRTLYQVTQVYCKGYPTGEIILRQLVLWLDIP